MSSSDSELELLSALLMDVRATLESMGRRVTSAQANVKLLRHTRTEATVEDIVSGLDALVREAEVVIDCANGCRAPLGVMLEGGHRE